MSFLAFVQVKVGGLIIFNVDHLPKAKKIMIHINIPTVFLLKDIEMQFINVFSSVIFWGKEFRDGFLDTGE